MEQRELAQVAVPLLLRRAGHKNASFGVLRSMNDDLVMPKRGFGEHLLRTSEIVTYGVEQNRRRGQQDSKAAGRPSGRGAVQFMTAGRGVRRRAQPRRVQSSAFSSAVDRPRASASAAARSAAVGDVTGGAAPPSNRWCRVVRPSRARAPALGSAPADQPGRVHLRRRARPVAQRSGSPTSRAHRVLLCVEGECVDRRRLAPGSPPGTVGEAPTPRSSARGAKLRLVAGARGAAAVRGGGRRDTRGCDDSDRWCEPSLGPETVQKFRVAHSAVGNNFHVFARSSRRSRGARPAPRAALTFLLPSRGAVAAPSGRDEPALAREKFVLPDGVGSSRSRVTKVANAGTYIVRRRTTPWGPRSSSPAPERRVRGVPRPHPRPTHRHQGASTRQTRAPRPRPVASAPLPEPAGPVAVRA